MDAGNMAAVQKLAAELREHDNAKALGVDALTVLVRKYGQLMGLAALQRNAHEIVARLESEMGVDTYGTMRLINEQDLVEICKMKRTHARLLADFFGTFVGVQPAGAGSDGAGFVADSNPNPDPEGIDPGEDTAAAVGQDDSGSKGSHHSGETTESEKSIQQSMLEQSAATSAAVLSLAQEMQQQSAVQAEQAARSEQRSNFKDKVFEKLQVVAPATELGWLATYTWLEGLLGVMVDIQGAFEAIDLLMHYPKKTKAEVQGWVNKGDDNFLYRPLQVALGKTFLLIQGQQATADPGITIRHKSGIGLLKDLVDYVLKHDPKKVSATVTWLTKAGVQYKIRQEDNLHEKVIEWYEKAFEVQHNEFVPEELLLESMLAYLQRWGAQVNTVAVRCGYYHGWKVHLPGLHEAGQGVHAAAGGSDGTCQG
jgi:hypothetical protein